MSLCRCVAVPLCLWSSWLRLMLSSKAVITNRWRLHRFLASIPVSLVVNMQPTLPHVGFVPSSSVQPPPTYSSSSHPKTHTEDEVHRYGCCLRGGCPGLCSPEVSRKPRNPRLEGVHTRINDFLCSVYKSYSLVHVMLAYPRRGTVLAQCDRRCRLGGAQQGVYGRRWPVRSRDPLAIFWLQ